MPEHHLKPCRVCYCGIHPYAIRCPYCLHWQTRLRAIIFSRSWAALAFLLLLSLVAAIEYQRYIVAKASLAREGKKRESFDSHRDELRVLNSEMAFSFARQETLLVTGVVRNDGDIAWAGLRFKVEFLNGQGEVVDSGHSTGRYLVALPQRETSFRVYFPVDHPRDDYVSHTIQVVWAYETFP